MPKNLFEQFHRLANIYFLFQIIIMVSKLILITLILQWDIDIIYTVVMISVMVLEAVHIILVKIKTTARQFQNNMQKIIDSYCSWLYLVKLFILQNIGYMYHFSLTNLISVCFACKSICKALYKVNARYTCRLYSIHKGYTMLHI